LTDINDESRLVLYCDVIEYVIGGKLALHVNKIPEYIREAHKALELAAVVKSKQFASDKFSCSNEDPKLQYFRIKLMQASAAVHHQQSNRVGARAECLKAVAYVKTSVSDFDLKVKSLYDLANILRLMDDVNDAKELLQELYCTICEAKGPSDVFLQTVVTDLGDLLMSSGDSDEAERFYRTTIENLKEHCQTTTESTADLVSAIVMLGTILHEKASDPEPEAALLVAGSAQESTKLALFAEAESLYKDAMSLAELNPVKLRPVYILALVRLNSLYLDQERIDEEVENSLKLALRFQQEHKQLSQSIADTASQLFQYYEIKLIHRVPVFTEDHPPTQGYRQDLLAAKSEILALAETAVTDSDGNADHDFISAFHMSLLQLGQKYLQILAYDNLDTLKDSLVPIMQAAESWVYHSEENWLKLPESIEVQEASQRNGAPPPSAASKYLVVFVEFSLNFTLGYAAIRFTEEIEAELALKKNDSAGSSDDPTASFHEKRKLEVVNLLKRVLLKEAMVLSKKPEFAPFGYLFSS
jgi:tetratricopeptide (TPR) repeat protein